MDKTWKEALVETFATRLTYGGQRWVCVIDVKKKKKRPMGVVVSNNRTPEIEGIRNKGSEKKVLRERIKRITLRNFTTL